MSPLLLGVFDGVKLNIAIPVANSPNPITRFRLIPKRRPAVDPNWKGGPHISFITSFPKPGLYKAWGQFQHKDKIIMADFILEVA